MDPSPARLAGQLGYLFEDEPDLQQAPAEELADRLNYDDRYARAREHYPDVSDAAVRSHLDEFPPRITIDDVRAALERLHD